MVKEMFNISVAQQPRKLLTRADHLSSKAVNSYCEDKRVPASIQPKAKKSGGDYGGNRAFQTNGYRKRRRSPDTRACRHCHSRFGRDYHSLGQLSVIYVGRPGTLVPHHFSYGDNVSGRRFPVSGYYEGSGPDHYDRIAYFGCV